MRQRRADQFFDGLESPVLHEKTEPGVQFIHDAQPVFHHDGAKLHRLGAQGQEVGRRLVVHRAAIAGHRDAHARHFRQRQVADRQHPFAGHADHHPLFPTPVLGPPEGQ